MDAMSTESKGAESRQSTAPPQAAHGDLYMNKLILAPLVGGSDLTYRLLCRKYGATLTYTEMCTADTYLQRIKATDPKKKIKNYVYEFHPDDRPLILQLAGNTAEPIIELANHDMFQGHIDGVDINCGCPQSFAMKRKIGAAMLFSPEVLVAMCARIVREVPYPVSVKMRIVENVENTIRLIERLREVGVCAVTVHGREWWQKGDKRGVNDWEAIRTIKAAFPDLVMFGNGDVRDFTDIARFAESGVDGVMVGYGALRNPAVFSATPVSLETVISDYLDIAARHSNRFIDVLRHLGWMLKGYVDAETRAKLFLCGDLTQVQSLCASQKPPLAVHFTEETARVFEERVLNAKAVKKPRRVKWSKWEKQ